MFIFTIFQTKNTYMFTVESYTCRTYSPHNPLPLQSWPRQVVAAKCRCQCYQSAGRNTFGLCQKGQFSFLFSKFPNKNRHTQGFKHKFYCFCFFAKGFGCLEPSTESTHQQGTTTGDFTARKDEVRWLLRSHKGRKGTGALWQPVGTHGGCWAENSAETKRVDSEKLFFFEKGGEEEVP